MASHSIDVDVKPSRGRVTAILASTQSRVDRQPCLLACCVAGASLKEDRRFAINSCDLHP